MGSNQQYANAIDEMIKKGKEKGALVFIYWTTHTPHPHPPPPKHTHTQTQKKSKVFY